MGGTYHTLLSRICCGFFFLSLRFEPKVAWIQYVVHVAWNYPQSSCLSFVNAGVIGWNIHTQIIVINGSCTFWRWLKNIGSGIFSAAITTQNISINLMVALQPFGINTLSHPQFLETTSLWSLTFLEFYINKIMRYTVGLSFVCLSFSFSTVQWCMSWNLLSIRVLKLLKWSALFVMQTTYQFIGDYGWFACILSIINKAAVRSFSFCKFMMWVGGVTW